MRVIETELKYELIDGEKTCVSETFLLEFETDEFPIGYWVDDLTYYEFVILAD